VTPLEALDGVADAVAAVTGMHTYSKTPGPIATPAALTELAGIVAPTDTGGTAVYSVKVVLLVQKGDQINSQERTLALLDPTGSTTASVFAALLDYDPVGQVSFDGPGLVEHSGQQYVGGIFTVTVFS
jgi:hypothetical protein